MAKSKQKDVVVDESKIEAAIIKEFGEGIFRSAQTLIDQPKKIVPLTPSLDIVLNGGVPESTILICSGLPKQGKTQTSLAFAANCQKMNKPTFYLDVEGRLRKMNLNGTHGLDPSKLNIIGSSQGNILSAEKWLDICSRILHDEPGCLIIFDSTSSLCSETELISTANSQTRPAVPKLLAQFFRRHSGVIQCNNSILWLTQHLYVDSSGRGPAKKIEDGGIKAGYFADIKLRIQYTEKWMQSDKEDSRQIGQKIHWSLIHSNLGGIPNSTTLSYLRYGHGIDFLMERIEIALSLGLHIRKSGAWYSFTGHDGSEVKLQGMEKLVSYLQENEKDYSILIQHIASVFS